MVQGKINRGRHSDNAAGRHSIRTKQCPPPPSPIFFTGQMPFLLPNQQCQSTELHNNITTHKFHFVSLLELTDYKTIGESSRSERWPNLCDVRISVRPAAQTCDKVFQRWRRATGSNPVDGSSRKMTGASPISATAVLNLRLFPPLHYTRNRRVLLSIFSSKLHYIMLCHVTQHCITLHYITICHIMTLQYRFVHQTANRQRLIGREVAVASITL